MIKNEYEPVLEVNGEHMSLTIEWAELTWSNKQSAILFNLSFMKTKHSPLPSPSHTLFKWEWNIKEETYGRDGAAVVGSKASVLNIFTAGYS
jgi:hypothetical protein